MALPDREDLYTKAIEVQGVEFQHHKAIEECAELIKVLCDFRSGRATLDDVASEVADVHIMVEILAQIIGPDLADHVARQKLRRMEVRLSKPVAKEVKP